jgi:endonuclease/exonuclease/phosphatase family metal-dependent hydrolase
MKKFLQSRFVFSIAIINVLLYITGALGLYIHPKYFVGFSFCTLGFPILFMGLVFFFSLFLWINKKKAVFVLIVMATGYKSIKNSFAFNLTTPIKANHSLKVMSWNINDIDLFHQSPIPEIREKQEQMIKTLKQENPDIISLIDYNSSTEYDKLFFDNVKKVADSCLGIKYVHIENMRNFKYGFNVIKRAYGTILLSKVPILKTGIIRYNLDSIFNEGLSYAEIQVKEKKVKVITTHFKSLQLKLSHQPVDAYEKLNYQDTILSFKTSKLKKLIIYDNIHTKQALITRRFLDTTTSPIIFCADLNSVPSSHTYHLLTKNLKDAFLEKGLGIGRTYNAISPTLRIDVILVSKSINVLSYKSPHLPYSDHYPIITTLNLP